PTISRGSIDSDGIEKVLKMKVRKISTNSTSLTRNHRKLPSSFSFAVLSGESAAGSTAGSVSAPFMRNTLWLNQVDTVDSVPGKKSIRREDKRARALRA